MHTSLTLLAMIAGIFLKEPEGEDREYVRPSKSSECPMEESCCEESDCEEPEEETDCTIKCVQLTESRVPDWTITSSAGPCVSCGSDMFLTAEFIAWTAREDHLGFALKQQTSTDAILSSTSKGEVIHPNWKLKPGFKVGVGMLFDCDGWDIYANYTWLKTGRTKTTATSTSTKTLVDLGWIQNSTDPYITSISEISGNWKHKFNTLDLELGRNFFISTCLHLRPHLGMKGSWQKQTMTVKETGLSATSSTVQAAVGQGEYTLDSWGIGIRSGLDTAWHFTPCWSIFGEFSATALWEYFDSAASVVIQNQATQLFTVPLHADDRFHSIKPVLEGYIGFRWEDWFCCDEYHWSIELGWEIQWWGDQNQFLNTTIETRSGNLGLQGLTLKTRFDF